MAHATHLCTEFPIKDVQLLQFFAFLIITEQIRNIFDFWETGIFFGKPCSSTILALAIQFQCQLLNLFFSMQHQISTKTLIALVLAPQPSSLLYSYISSALAEQFQCQLLTLANLQLSISISYLAVFFKQSSSRNAAYKTLALALLLQCQLTRLYALANFLSTAVHQLQLSTSSNLILEMYVVLGVH